MQGFQIDHISPINRTANMSFENTTANIQAFNDPTNLIAVCRTCNASKNNYAITQDWLYR